MATVAVFVALGGSSYAAVSLAKNSVGSRQIRNGQVKKSDLARNAVTSAKVKNGSLLAADFKAGQLVAGTRGATGPKGDTGPQGVPGADGSKLQAANIRTVVGPTETVPAMTSSTVGAKDAFASCAAGETVIGGGFIRGDFNEAFASISSPDPNNPGRWFVRILNYSVSTVNVQATAICVKTV
jgi:hypothetical protein